MILIVLGIVFNISIMMFRTGSMSPTITAGSIAFVKEIPATEISVDDIVTVERGDADLPVTHRVVEILKTNDSGVVTFTMKETLTTPLMWIHTASQPLNVCFSRFQALPRRSNGLVPLMSWVD